jgi:hypothetical protein
LVQQSKIENLLSADHKDWKLPLPLADWLLQDRVVSNTSERIGMRTFVVKLAAWHRVFKDLEDARLRLAQAEAARPRDSRAAQVREDVRRLQRTCDLALGELRAAADAYVTAGRKQIDTIPFEKQRALVERRWDSGLGIFQQ